MTKYQKEYLTALDRSDYWRLFVDGFRQRSDTSTEETSTEFKFKEYQLGSFFWSLREPSGLDTIKLAAKEIYSSNISEELTDDFIKEVVKLSFPFQDHLRLSSDYISNGDVRFFGESSNQKDILWIDSRAKAIQKTVESKNAPWSLQDTSIKCKKEISVNWNAQEKVSYYSKILSNYNTSILKDRSDQEKIKIIAQHIQDIECLHFFQDGNCRVAYLLLNKELMRNDLCPVILFNPNNFDFMNLDDLSSEITKGQKAYKSFIDKGLSYEESLSQDKINNNIKSIKKDDFNSYIENLRQFKVLIHKKYLDYTKGVLSIITDIKKQKSNGNYESSIILEMAIKTLLSISDINLFAYLGVTEKERLHKQKISLDISFQYTNIPVAAISDNLSDTFCYADLVTKIKIELENKTFKLVESLSNFILQYIKNYIKKSELSNCRITVKVTKCSASIISVYGRVSFSIFCDI